MTDQHLWWQKGIIYQIYPRSFQDSNNDGIGDLAGIRQRLDYLQWLGVDAVWLSPIYPSPMADFGYDISNYIDIDPLFGTLADFDALIADVHGRGMKLVLDFVPNHTSDAHPWFTESRASRDNDKANWYIWRDPAPDGGPPNNWLSSFGGSGWEYDAQRGQYFYHAFLKEQPDLNWRNPAVQQAMLEVMRFWLDRGVDGFRVDVIWHLIKDEDFRANPPNPQYNESMGEQNMTLTTYTTDRPEVHQVIGKMRQLLDEYDERMMVGEIYLPVEKLVTYYGTGGDGVNLPFNFQLIALPWKAEEIRAAVDHYETALPPFGWPNWVLGNHDNHRILTRIGKHQARVAAMLLLTLRGTPTMYYGDEIGMHDIDVPPELVQDPFEKKQPGKGLGRDPERSPMQWSDEANAGFSGAAPWLPVAPDYPSTNVAGEAAKRNSLLGLYRALLALRREQPALAIGSYRGFSTPDGVLGFLREQDNARLLVLLNFTANDIPVPHHNLISGKVLLSSFLDRKGEQVDQAFALRAHEGVIIEVAF
ncbi:Oligo-1,6-glucosidase [Andreprevotia sp. IGB-42]|uniref:alpha-amylase family glycosyl hydrolase n=1 Tax=Andreprevotia sp. IGB-42 TaxID=2497473 RepID=UPI00135A9444|nr:alpha-amylase family glycosyl hydrolase [Andreprevotia sp. IGB-42]KAF0813364.1 Oligo-1,6-glucosidase [Andreprevotia sp. IGB-42]